MVLAWPQSQRGSSLLRWEILIRRTTLLRYATDHESTIPIGTIAACVLCSRWLSYIAAAGQTRGLCRKLHLRLERSCKPDDRSQPKPFGFAIRWRLRPR